MLDLSSLQVKFLVLLLHFHLVLPDLGLQFLDLSLPFIRLLLLDSEMGEVLLNPVLLSVPHQVFLMNFVCGLIVALVDLLHLNLLCLIPLPLLHLLDVRQLLFGGCRVPVDRLHPLLLLLKESVFLFLLDLEAKVLLVLLIELASMFPVPLRCVVLHQHAVHHGVVH